MVEMEAVPKKTRASEFADQSLLVGKVQEANRDAVDRATKIFTAAAADFKSRDPAFAKSELNRLIEDIAKNPQKYRIEVQYGTQTGVA